MFCLFLSLLSDTNVKTKRANNGGLHFVHFTHANICLTIHIPKQERKAHMVAYTMSTVAYAFINITCVY